MQTNDKDQIWQLISDRVARTVDGLGMRIDRGIRDTVLALNAVGINTTASCAGHRHRAAPYPWVDVAHKDADAVEQKILVLLQEGKRELKETKLLMKQYRLLLLQEEQKLVNLLNAFYQVQSFDYDRHLSIWRFAKGEPRLQSYGAEYQEFRSKGERELKLKAYQQEIQQFALFLKDRFFSEPEK